MKMHLAFLFSTSQELQASAAMVLMGGWATLSLRGEKRAEVLAQSVHHLLSEGGRGYLAVFLSIAQHKHRSLRCACPEQALNAASPIQPLSEWTRALTAHTSFLSGCTCSVGPQESAVCLSCCCCVDRLFLISSGISDGFTMTYGGEPDSEPALSLLSLHTAKLLHYSAHSLLCSRICHSWS